MRYFEGIQTLTELKVAYKKLAMAFHPDRGGDTEIMKAINNEYEAAFNNLKDSYNKTAKEQGTYETNEMPEQYRDVILNIIDLEGVEIELIGNWIWVSGNTYEHKAILKENGFTWANNKKMWYWRPEEYKTYSRKSKDINDIRNKYGSEKIVNNTKSLK